MLSLGPLAFAAPWVLLSLAILPVIWWLLRVTPPAPRRVRFPAVRLLLGLQQGEETPARTPLWLLLLRMLVAALVILALADPYLNPQAGGTRDSAVVIVVDNSWAAAARWDDRIGAMQSLAAEAERDGRPLVVVPTAPGDTKLRIRKLTGADAQGAIKAVAPQPFPVDRLPAIKPLATTDLAGRPDIIWLSDGMDDANTGEFLAQLRALGDLRVLRDMDGDTPLALTQPTADGNALVFRVIRGTTGRVTRSALKALGARGQYLATQEFEIPADKREVTVRLDIATELRNELARVEIADRSSAGSAVLIDERWRRRPVGLVSGQSVDAAQPLLSDLFYLERALKPYAELHEGRIADLVKAGLSVLVVADVGQIVGDDRTRVADWVQRGGVLVRFAGQKMAAQADDLIPGKLRSGGRMMGSAMSWDKPQALAEWPEGSPFLGLTIPGDVRVQKQVLTDPGAGIDHRTWAQLQDGTPLVSAVPSGRGWIVLFHITSNTTWSDLPMSGLFVDMLRRTIALSAGLGTTQTADARGGVLTPVETLDGFGRLSAPAASALPIKAGAFDTIDAGPAHPPGFYGDAGQRRAFNLFRPDAVVRALPTLPSGIRSAAFGLKQTAELKYPIMVAALLLALADLLIGYVLRGLVALPALRTRALAPALLMACACVASASQAFADDDLALKATLKFRLAYVQTGDAQVDAMSRAGLEGLTQALRLRSAVEPDEPVAIDLESDELAFFPLIYWPITAAQPQLSATAMARVDAFMRNGGTLLVDTRDQGTSLPAGTGNAPPASFALRRLLAGLDIPPLEPLTQKHVLSKTFFILKEYPGRWPSGRVWVESQQSADDGTTTTTASDGVSPIIVGGADWAAAWAEDAEGRPLAAVVPGGEQQREMAVRFGINLVMYTLTGNYKADLVHVPHILERLGQ